MNFLNKNRFLTWLLIVLVFINLSALASFLIYIKTRPALVTCETQPAQGCALRNELELSDEQAGSVDLINSDYKNNVEPIVSDIRDLRSEIIDELDKESPDTVVLNRLASGLSSLQNKMQKENIRQYLELKKICAPNQALRLSELYRDLYGCPMKGKGMQHRYRHGQGIKGN